MPTEPTVSVHPTPENWPAMAVWSVANRRGVRGLAGRGFAVPERLLGDVPIDLLVGAKVNGQVYYPDSARIALDAPPVDEGDDLGAGSGAAPTWPRGPVTYPPAPVFDGLPDFDDIATTGAPESPALDESP